MLRGHSLENLRKLSKADLMIYYGIMKATQA
jgi:hypothetical protein